MRCAFSYIKEQLSTILKTYELEDAAIARITVEPPKDPSHGDMATNAAMVLCKQVKQNPRQFAESLKVEIEKIDGVVSVEIAGPGFINMRLSESFWFARLSDILDAGISYGDSNLGNGEKVNVEYVSANPTGPMHVGHTRGAVLGDVLCNLMAKVGYDVTREYYINDAGSQVDILAQSAFLRYREALGEDIGEIPAGFYPGDYLVAVGESLKEEFGDSLKDMDEAARLEKIKPVCLRMMMDLIREDLNLLGVNHDVFTSELDLRNSGAVDRALKALEDKDLLYVGVLEPPKGKTPEDWEPRPQTLFKSTQFGDDVDRAIKKSDGSWTYFAPDIAYHYDKAQRGFNNMIDILGADHGGYVKRIQAATRAMTDDQASLDVQICNLVNLMEDGQAIKMSKRAGTIVSLRDIVEKVGRDVVRFMLLTRKNDTVIDFDLKKVLEQSKDNPVFYVQYANARCHSVFGHAANMFDESEITADALKNEGFDSLTGEAEMALIKLLASWPRIVDSAAHHHEPHRLAYYLYDLASAFHSLWNMGRDDANLRFLIEDDPAKTKARLALLRALSIIISSGLHVFGITAVTEMR